MLLIAHAIRLGEPGAKLVIDVGLVDQAEDVYVISWRNRVDAAESRRLQPSREHDVAVEPLLTRRHLRERYARLKRDARFLRQHADGAEGIDGVDDRIEERANVRRLSAKVCFEIVRAAGVRLIAIREFSPALRATPQPLLGHGSSVIVWTLLPN